MLLNAAVILSRKGSSGTLPPEARTAAAVILGITIVTLIGIIVYVASSYGSKGGDSSW